ncbi:hypothetical protein [Paenibacillus sp. N3.4]|uniref:hypothetical protein n=1 Tax=Paenibacillus sp. N3.4 TaxID=2603222 RepID=UPI001C9C73E2|nr:hypothetical protein [Paenibacillus sp. N3.4]
MESSVIINKVVEELKISSRAMDKRVLLNLIADMLEKKKSGDYRVIDEVELLALQEGLANHKLASVQHVKLQRPDIAIEITVPDIGTKVLQFDPKYKLQSEMSPNIV